MGARMSTGLFFVLLLFVPAILAARDSGDTDDFTAYVDQIRKWGMTENARMSIGMMASIQAGSTIPFFQKDDSTGAYFSGYRSASCPKPDMSEAERQELRDEYAAKTDPLIEKMRLLADTNNSGFITTEEGAEFRAIVEFGYRASHVVNNEGHDMKKICAGLSMSEERVREQAGQYKKLRVEARAAGLDFPDLDL